MKFLNVTTNGTENFKLSSYDRAVIYVEGTDGGASFNVECHGAVLGQVTTSEPLLITYGTGAPLKLVTTSGSGTDVTFYAYPVE